MRALLLAGLVLVGVACTATTEGTPRVANQVSQEAADRFCADLLSEPLATEMNAEEYGYVMVSIRFGVN